MEENTQQNVPISERVVSEFEKELSSLINKYSRENMSDTPDFILAEYLDRCLTAYSVAVGSRDHWFGVNMWDKKEFSKEDMLAAWNGKETFEDLDKLIEKIKP